MFLPEVTRYPCFRPLGDHALVVDFADSFSDAAHGRVMQLDAALTALPFTGFCEAVPAFVSLSVVFDPVLCDHAVAEAQVRLMLQRPDTDHPTPRRHNVPICYDDEFGPDLAEVSRRTGLAPDAVIQAHLSGEYRVYMYGFAPGYAYLGGVPMALRLDRKLTPVRDVPAGSVIIAGPQCLITTLTMPTGWWIIGKSPLRILTGDSAHPFLFATGDQIRFRRISRAEFAPGDGAI